ncbi:EpsG family protein [Photobacterium leiognathi]|uniref:EpsG family protein n=1 Tax=Photobacterium leiognathi TaxID=553611 RepID=UPI002980AEEC|nr:EpsG family protein [Photobacterium leiognathi]
MSVLLVLLFVSYVLISYIYTGFYKSKKYQLFCLFLSFLLMLIFATLKDANTSHDTSNYIFIFQDYLPDSLYQYISNIRSYEFEYGYSFLTVFMKSLGVNYTFSFFIYGLIALIPILITIKRDSQWVICSLLIYVFCFFFKNEIIIIRYGMSCGLFLLGLSYLNNGNNKKSLLLFLMAFLFHYTALIALVVFILAQVKYSKKIVLFSSIIISFGILISPIEIMAKLLLMYPDLKYVGIDRIVRYAGIESAQGIKAIILYIPFGIFIMLTFDYLYANYKAYLTSTILMFFSFVLFNEVSSLSRVYLMYSMALIILIPNIFNQIGNKWLKLSLFLYLILFTTYIFTRQNIFNTGGSINFY